MKNLKILLAIFFTALAFSSCQKSGDDEMTPTQPTPPGSGISPVPSQFGKKVLLEVFTSATNQMCPDGDRILGDILTTFSDDVYGVCIHANDNLSIGLYTSLDFAFSNNGFPTGMVNRKPNLGNVILNRTQWLSNASAQLSGNPVGGLAIKSDFNSNTLTVEVHAGFRTAVSGDYRVTIYLVEDGVTGTGSGYDQMNYFNNDPSSPFYNLGNPIVGYAHNNVVRKTLTADLGDQVAGSAMVAGGDHVITKTVNTSTYNNSKLKVVAFINKVGNSATTHEIINVQQVKAGVTKDWD